MNRMVDAHIIQLPKIEDPRGNLSFIQQMKEIPFEIQRTYWIYDVPGGKDRGSHAYKRNEEFIVALSGSFDVELDDGQEKRLFSLNRSYNGLYVPKGMWRTMRNFSTNSLALVLASTPYDENDYIRSYSEFVRWAGGRGEDSSSSLDAINEKTPRIHKHLFALSNQLPNVFDCSLCQLSKIHHPEGNLTFVYPNISIPFDVERVFYTYDIPGGEDRGAHAHKYCHQFIIAASGAFDVVLDDGINKRTVQLNRPFWGLHVPPGIWASEQSFSSGSICLVLASQGYSEDDYIRDYAEFKAYSNTLREEHERVENKEVREEQSQW